jgi:serine/threonine protein kinase
MGLEGHVLGGRYEAVKPVGAGGMARVYKGTDRVLDRTIAIKVLAAPFDADPGFVERLRREARSAAGLSHPNVVAVFDSGSDGGIHYIVMEWIEGESVAELIRREGPLESARASVIAEGVCEALAAAHDMGVVHRDVKPANVMVGRDGQVKVLDFGIAKALTAETLTRTGTTLGTAAYISPEQARGVPGDGRSDLYSLGCTLYEMLTGRPPFVGDTPVVVASRRLTEEPERPSNVRPGVSAGLDAVVMKALAKDLSVRYQDGRAMAEDLRRAARGLPLVLGPSGDEGTGTIELAEETTEVLPEDRTPPLPVAAPVPASRRDGPSPRRSAIVAGLLFGGLAVLGLILFLALNRGGSPPPKGEPTSPAVSSPPNVAQALANLTEVVTAGEQAGQVDPGGGDDILHRAQDIVRKAQAGHLDDALHKLSELQMKVNQLVQMGKITSASRAAAIRNAVQALGQAVRRSP